MHKQYLFLCTKYAFHWSTRTYILAYEENTNSKFSCTCTFFSLPSFLQQQPDAKLRKIYRKIKSSNSQDEREWVIYLHFSCFSVSVARLPQSTPEGACSEEEWDAKLVLTLEGRNRNASHKPLIINISTPTKRKGSENQDKCPTNKYLHVIRNTSRLSGYGVSVRIPLSVHKSPNILKSTKVSRIYRSFFYITLYCTERREDTLSRQMGVTRVSSRHPTSPHATTSASSVTLSLTKVFVNEK